MSDGLFAIGTILALHDGVSAYATVAEVTELSGPSMTADAVEYTNHSSPNFTREFKPGLVDPGEISLAVNWIPDSVTHGLTAGIAYLLKNRLLRSWRITWVDGTIWTFDAFVTAFGPDAPVDGKLAASVTLKLTGFPVET